MTPGDTEFSIKSLYPIDTYEMLLYYINIDKQKRRKRK
jgi:hypothetical protein